jgi:hypothetical protein
MGLVTALTLLGPGAVRGQVPWDVPTFMRPGAPAGLSLFLIDPDGPGGLGGVAAWRARAAPVGVGFRAGLANGPRHRAAALFGVDVSGPLGVTGPPSGPSILWWAGAGLGVGDDIIASFPLGVVLGWSVEGDGVSFHPFVGGHLALDAFTAGEGRMELGGALDLGVDLDFPSGWDVRFAASLGDREGVGIGVRLPGT